MTGGGGCYCDEAEGDDDDGGEGWSWGSSSSIRAAMVASSLVAGARPIVILNWSYIGVVMVVGDDDDGQQHDRERGRVGYLDVRGGERADAVSEGELVEVAVQHDALVLLSVSLGQLTVHVRLPKLHTHTTHNNDNNKRDDIRSRPSNQKTSKAAGDQRERRAPCRTRRRRPGTSPRVVRAAPHRRPPVNSASEANRYAQDEDEEDEDDDDDECTTEAVMMSGRWEERCGGLANTTRNAHQPEASSCSTSSEQRTKTTKAKAKKPIEMMSRGDQEAVCGGGGREDDYEPREMSGR